MSVHALMRHAASGRWRRYADPVGVLCADGPHEVGAVVREAEARSRRDRLHAVGFLTYEAAPGLAPTLRTHAPGVLPAAWFALFTGFRGISEPAPARVPALAWRPSLPADAYRGAVADIRRRIGAGETYQVNFSYRLRAWLPDDTGAVAGDLFRAMLARQPHGLGAFIDAGDWALCCASHELFFARRGRLLSSRPMKGTAPRGATPEEDHEHARWLEGSLKNRAENLMITDMVRNDIGRLADVGSVRTQDLFRLEPYPTLWQMTSTVHGNTGARLDEILTAMFPAASITGAPKRRTMDIIHELEAEPREIYTGTIGLMEPDGDVQFNVAIRTAWVDKRRRQAEYGVGGGILWDSDADEELAETRTKARILHNPNEVPLRLLETLLWQPETGYWLLDAHLARLQAAAGYFFGESVDEPRVTDCLVRLTRTFSAVPHRVRLLVGDNLDVEATAAPLDPAARPRRVALTPARAALIGNPLVRHKTTWRHVYDTARCDAAAAAPGADEALLVNERGELTESTIANLVVDLDGTLVTPPVSCGLLPGVYRQHLLDSGKVVERVVRPEDLRHASAIYLANSVRGLWPVTVSSGG